VGPAAARGPVPRRPRGSAASAGTLGGCQETWAKGKPAGFDPAGFPSCGVVLVDVDDVADLEVLEEELRGVVGQADAAGGLDVRGALVERVAVVGEVHRV